MKQSYTYAQEQRRIIDEINAYKFRQEQLETEESLLREELVELKSVLTDMRQQDLTLKVVIFY